MAESPEVRRLARELAQLKQAVRVMQTSPQMGFVSLDDAAINAYDAGGTLMQTIGRQRDGTFASVTRDGPVPPVPSAPTEVVGGPGSIAATWDGTFVDGVDAPGDFAAVEVWAAEADFDDIGDAQLVAPIASAAGGQGTGRLTVGAWHVALVTRAQSGKRSAPSERVVVEVESVVDQAIIDELNNKLADMPSITYAAAPPTLEDGDGKPFNAIWRQIGIVGGDWALVAEYIWTSSGWLEVPISDNAIFSLDVAKLRASEAQIDEAVITKLWVDLFAANKVTAGEIDVQDLWADTAFLGELNSATITGAIIRTAASGMRVELDSANMLRIFNADEERVLWADALGNLVLGGDISLTGGITTETPSSRLEITSGELRLTPKGYLDEQAEIPWDLPESASSYRLPLDVTALDTTGQFLFVQSGQGTRMLRVDLDTGQATDEWTLPYSAYGRIHSTHDGWVYWTANRGDGYWVYRMSQTTGTQQVVCQLPAPMGFTGWYVSVIGVLDTGHLILRGVATGATQRVLYGVATSSGTVVTEWLGGNSPQSSVELYAAVNSPYGHVYGCEATAAGFVFTAWSSTGALLAERAVSNRTTITVSADGASVYLSERGVGQLTILNAADLSTRTSWAAPSLTTPWAQVSVAPDEETVWAFDYSAGITKSTVVTESDLEGGGEPITITAAGIYSPVRIRTGTVETGRIHNNGMGVDLESPVSRSGLNVFTSTAQRDAALTSGGAFTNPGIEAATASGNDAARKWMYEADPVGGYLAWSEILPLRTASLGTTPLNEVTRPGVYFQTSASNATFGRQYPEEGVRGVLEVLATGASNSVIVQRYSTIGTTSTPGNVWERSRNTLTSGWSPWALIGGGNQRPFLMDAGSVTVTADSSGLGTAPVTFTTKFTAVPEITTTSWSASMAISSTGYTNPTTTGFDAVMRRSNTTATSVSWTAVQMLGA